MNLPYSLILFLALLAFSCTQSSDKVENAVLLNSDELEAQLSENSQAQLLDVRTPEEYNSGRLPNAINIDYQGGNFEEQINQLQKDKPVYVYCAIGGRSAKASKILKEKGFTEVYDLEGGIKKWQENGKEVIK